VQTTADTQLLLDSFFGFAYKGAAGSTVRVVARQLTPTTASEDLVPIS
jgi:hypothetical protein